MHSDASWQSYIGLTLVFPNLNRVKRLVNIYKQTRDPEVFAQILFLLDRLILYFMYKLIKKRPYLKGIKLQELYHTGIIALEDIIKKMPEDVESKKIPAWLKSYMDSHLRKMFIYRFKETTDLDVLLPELESQYRHDLVRSGGKITERKWEAEMIMSDYNSLVAKGIVSQKEDRVIRKWMLGMSLREISAEEGISCAGVSLRIKRALKRLKLFF